MSLRTCLLHLLFQQLWVCRTQTISQTCSKLSVRQMLQCLSKQGSHTEQLDVRCLRWCARYVRQKFAKVSLSDNILILWDKLTIQKHQQHRTADPLDVGVLSIHHTLPSGGSVPRSGSLDPPRGRPFSVPFGEDMSQPNRAEDCDEHFSCAGRKFLRRGEGRERRRRVVCGGARGGRQGLLLVRVADYRNFRCGVWSRSSMFSPRTRFTSVS